jgi:hypothetical protein
LEDTKIIIGGIVKKTTSDEYQFPVKCKDLNALREGKHALKNALWTLGALHEVEEKYHG